MTYQKLNSKKANDFKNQHHNYNVYIYNGKIYIFKMGEGRDYNCSNFLYLVNSDENVIKMSELCKDNDYDVIFVQPDEIDLPN